MYDGDCIPVVGVCVCAHHITGVKCTYMWFVPMWALVGYRGAKLTVDDLSLKIAVHVWQCVILFKLLKNAN